jgi:hypothetical protein
MMMMARAVKTWMGVALVCFMFLVLVDGASFVDALKARPPPRLRDQFSNLEGGDVHAGAEEEGSPVPRADSPDSGVVVEGDSGVPPSSFVFIAVSILAVLVVAGVFYRLRYGSRSQRDQIHAVGIWSRTMALRAALYPVQLVTRTASVLRQRLNRGEGVAGAGENRSFAPSSSSGLLPNARGMQPEKAVFVTKERDSDEEGGGDGEVHIPLLGEERKERKERNMAKNLPSSGLLSEQRERESNPTASRKHVNVDTDIGVADFDIQAPLVVSSPEPGKKKFDFPFPQLLDCECQPLLSDRALMQVYSCLPRVLTHCNLQLVYSLQQHGASFTAFLDQIDEKFDYAQQGKPFAGANLLVVEDCSGYVFGAFLAEGWRTSSQGYFGSGESFVMQIRPTFKVHRWSQRNSFFQLFNNEMIAVGGGDNFALVLTENFKYGGSGPCATYNSPMLASEEDCAINEVQCWAFK